ncbi:CobW family GTP-binding protein [Ferrimonas lipolytica]|uniref:GTP-binding protein n=1 Tax=Ferrimonas lipolytica TaxID=2724191 RepID=A0A6H1UCZ0_9GAMM|nr:CobW family GTP-binding protein [Ferrimonas lipolytica]QIZ75672.1 GTP-binding protein [Ferrimonas lipolytica]
MPLSTLFPPSVMSDPERLKQSLITTCLMRVNFVPGVRQAIGWRGMRESQNTLNAIALKHESQAGIFALVPIKHGNFAVLYFPEADEPLINCFTVRAGVVRAQLELPQLLSQFGQSEPLQSLFKVAELTVDVSRSGSVQLNLLCLDRDYRFTQEPIILHDKQGEHQLVAAGGLDQNLRAYELVLPLFDSICTSLNHCINASPSQLMKFSEPVVSPVQDNHGLMVEIRDEGSQRLMLSLRWSHSEVSMADSEISWRHGEPVPLEFAKAMWWQRQIKGNKHSLDKSSLGINERPKLILLTGFLGAGKTTFLNNFIDYQTSKNRFTAVIQNEFGQQHLDAALIGQDYAVERMDEGCVCCSLIDNLHHAIERIQQHYQPDFIVLETTGLANPANLLPELSELAGLIQIASITCVVDAVSLSALHDRYQIVADQIRFADVILLTKTDRLAAGDYQAVINQIRGLNCHALVEVVTHGDVNPSALYGINFEGGKVKLPRFTPLVNNDHQQYGIGSIVWRPTKPVNRQQLEQMMAQLPTTVLRAKGVILMDDGRNYLLQYVPNFLAITPTTVTEPKPKPKPTAAQENFVVFIGEQIEQVAALYPQ